MKTKFEFIDPIGRILIAATINTNVEPFALQMILWASMIFGADDSTSSSDNKLVCNQNSATSASFKLPDPTDGDKVARVGFGDELKIEWKLADSSVSINAALQIKLPNADRKVHTIKVVGSGSKYTWTPTPNFVDDITGDPIVLQNGGPYYIVLHDNNTATDPGCQGGISDATSKQITFFTPGGSTGGVARGSSSIKFLDMAVLALMSLVFQ